MMFIFIFKCLSKCDKNIDGNRTRTASVTGEHSTSRPFNFTRLRYRLGVYSCKF